MENPDKVDIVKLKEGEVKSVKENSTKIANMEMISPAKQEFLDIKFMKKNDTCCIVGFAPSWSEAPYKEKDIDFWGINELYTELVAEGIETPFAAWFEIHNIKDSPSKQHPIHQEFLRTCKIPLVTQKHWDEYPRSIAYPREYIKTYFNRGFDTTDGGAGFSDYSNQIAWMIALAIALNYKKIMVYGVDMAQATEYAFQRASCQFFLGYAAGRRIELKIPATCQLLKAGCDYGFESDNTNRFSLKDKIKVNNGNVVKLEQRNSHLDYLIQKNRDKLTKAETEYALEIEKLKFEMNEIEKYKFTFNECKKMLEDMPQKADEVYKKKNKLINDCIINLDKYEKDSKKLNKIVKDIDKLIEQRRTEAYIKIKGYENEKNLNTQELNIIRGSVGECKHLLNNNLV